MSTTAKHPPGADVRVLPPLLYAGPLVALSALGRAVPLRIPGRPATAWAGGALVAGGVALAASGAGTFLRHGTTLVPHHVPSSFVTTGPYRLTRNPMYLGMALAYAGATLALGSWWPVFGLPVSVAAVDRLVIAREESYLRQRYGTAYLDYCARVRRWL